MNIRGSFPVAVSAFHWVVAFFLLAAVGTVLCAQNATDKDVKGRLMFYHKSCGFTVFFLMWPRIVARVHAQLNGLLPPALSSTSAGVHVAAQAVHFLLYVVMVFMSVSGVLIGLFGGKGLPFWVTSFPSPVNADVAFAVATVGLHSSVGHLLKILLAMHIGATIIHHTFLKDPILLRILPWSNTRSPSKVV
eukprot:TRINITY_DN60543_c0_g1_i1.p1 TRINITY_DN60543_c0_g1~~TRINITY_DN60543_c0_g1_i1.p1  ORF type:complete len:191 (-),score=17.32 TRINITY_DN60543_c0_g1_i1:142-714(-)